MALLIEKPWRTQPTGPVTVDWTNPVSQGLVFAFFGINRVNFVSGLPSSIVGSISATSTNVGLSYNFIGNNSYLQFAHTKAIDITGPLSIFCMFLPASGATTARLLSKATTDGDTNPYRLSFESSVNGLYFVRAGNGTVFGGWRPNSVAAVANVLNTVCIVSDGSTVETVPKFYSGFSGADLGATRLFSSNTGAITSANDPLQLGNWSTANNCRILVMFVFARAISSREYVSLVVNPYQIFRPLELQLNSPPAPRIYYVAGPNATWATPTSTEIINGQLAGGGAATASWSESAPLTTTVPFNFSQPASPLTTGTKYRAAAVQKAGDSNVVSNVVVSDPFLAGAATLSNPEATDITSTTTKPKVTVSY